MTSDPLNTCSETHNTADPIDKLIRSGSSLSEIALQCGGMKNAMAEYGRRIAAFFPSAQDTADCSQCQSTNRVEVAQWEWLGVYMPFWVLPMMAVLMIFGWHLHFTYHVKFRTFHPLCENCLRPLRMRRIAAWIMYLIAVPLLFASVVIFGLLIFDQATLFSLVGVYGEGNVPLAMFIGGAALVVGVIMLLGQDRLPLPSALAFVGRSPFNLSSVPVSLPG